MPLSAESVTTGVAGSTVFTIGASGVTIDGFVVQGSTNANLFGASIYMQPASPGRNSRTTSSRQSGGRVRGQQQRGVSRRYPAKPVPQQHSSRPGKWTFDLRRQFHGRRCAVGTDRGQQHFTNTSLVVDSWTLGMVMGDHSFFQHLVHQQHGNESRPGAYFYNTKDSIVSGNTISGTTNYAVGIFDFAPVFRQHHQHCHNQQHPDQQLPGHLGRQFPDAPIDAVAYVGALISQAIRSPVGEPACRSSTPTSRR